MVSFDACVIVQCADADFGGVKGRCLIKGGNQRVYGPCGIAGCDASQHAVKRGAPDKVPRCLGVYLSGRLKDFNFHAQGSS